MGYIIKQVFYYCRKNTPLNSLLVKQSATSDSVKPSTSKSSLSTSSAASADVKKSDKIGEKRKNKSALDEIMEVYA